LCHLCVWYFLAMRPPICQTHPHCPCQPQHATHTPTTPPHFRALPPWFWRWGSRW
jgi:hypothetical protein